MALKQKTVYFREEDLPKWESIKNKAEWLHDHLNNPIYEMALETVRLEYLEKHPEKKKDLKGLDFLFDEPTITEPEETL